MARFAANVAKLMSYAVDHADKDAVRDGMSPLNGTPCVMLRHAEIQLFRPGASRLPWDKKEYFAPCSAVGRAPSGYHSSTSSRRAFPCVRTRYQRLLKAEVARSEIIFLVVKRIVRDVHFAIKTPGASIGVKHGGGVVIKVTRAPLKDRRATITILFSRVMMERASVVGPGSGSARSKKCGMSSRWQKYCVRKSSRQADHLEHLALWRPQYLLLGPAKVIVRVGGAVYLNQANGKRFWVRHGQISSRIYQTSRFDSAACSVFV